MRKTQRLQSARATQWVETYPGNNLVRGYKRWFGVDELTAVIELRELGVNLPAGLEADLRRKAAGQAGSRNNRARRKQEVEELDTEFDSVSDGTFAFIAGYTSGGVPYGTRWEDPEESGGWREGAP